MELLKSAESSAPNLTAKRVCGGCKQFTFQSLKENTPVAGLCSRETHWQSAGVLKHRLKRKHHLSLVSLFLSGLLTTFQKNGKNHEARSTSLRVCALPHIRLAWHGLPDPFSCVPNVTCSAPLKSTLVCLSKADMHESEIVRAFAELLNYTESESSRLAAFPRHIKAIRLNDLKMH